MNDIEALQKKSEELQARFKAIETKLIVSETQRDVIVKELKEDFGIEPHEIDDKIKEIEQFINEDSTKIKDFQDKLDVKLITYEGILNNA